MEYQEIIELVHAAKSIVFDADLRKRVTLKGDADFVTAVDFAISDFIKAGLKRICPQAGFMSEEEKAESLPSERFILDPIDGTTNLVYDYRQSSVSLAHVKDGEVVFGVVYNPYSGETFTAEKGKGAYLNGVKLDCAPDRELSDCLIEFGAGSSHKGEAGQIFDTACEIFCDCLDLRRMCSSALALCYIACGRLNGYFEKVLKPWDYAAASLILSETGGKISNFQGNAISFEQADSVIAGTPKAYAYLLKKFKSK